MGSVTDGRAVTARELGDALAGFAAAAADGFYARFMPDGHLSNVVAGYRSYPRTDSAVTAMLGALAALGVERVGGVDVADRLRAVLADVGRTDYATWWSLNIAETLVATGSSFADHPLLAGFDTATRDRIAFALDSTRIVDVEKGTLIGHPNNYWMCMARLELARQRLGLLTDTRVLDLCLQRTEEMLRDSPCGFMDDHHEGKGRYDNYSFHFVSGMDELAALLPADSLLRSRDAHARLLLALARPRGLNVCWGRSAGNNAFNTLDMAARLLRDGERADGARLLGLAAEAADWLTGVAWADDAVFAHRRGMSHWYLGPFRLLEQSLNFIGSAAGAARAFRALADIHPDLRGTRDAAVLYPEHEDWVPFDDRGAGVWAVRQGTLDFQLPLVEGYTSDYAAAPLQPGAFEQPVDQPMACGVPNLFYGEKRYLPLHHPVDVNWNPGSLSWTSEGFSYYEDFDWWKPTDDVGGTRTVTMRMDDDALEVEEHWHFAQLPDALAIYYAEVDTPLSLTWHYCSAPSRASVVVVDGMPAWRSYWGPLRRVHQLDIDPAEEVTVRYRLQTGNGGSGE